MIKKQNKLSVVRQCHLLEIHRSSIYYQPAPPDEEALELMRLIDVIHTNRPFLGSRRIRDALRDVGHKINRKRVQNLMRKMGIQAIHPGPKTSKRCPQHKIYPYLLRDQVIDQANQVWATDITYSAPILQRCH